MYDKRLIMETLKEALSEAVKEIIEMINAGEFDMMERVCECGHSEHRAIAVFCVNCGKKL